MSRTSTVAVLVAAFTTPVAHVQAQRENQIDFVLNRLQFMQHRLEAIASDDDLTEVQREEQWDAIIAKMGEEIEEEYVEIEYEITDVTRSSLDDNFRIYVKLISIDTDSADSVKIFVPDYFYKELSDRERRITVKGARMTLTGRITVQHQKLTDNPDSLSLDARWMRLRQVFGAEYSGVEKLDDHNLGIFLKRARVQFREAPPDDGTDDR